MIYSVLFSFLTICALALNPASSVAGPHIVIPMNPKAEVSFYKRDQVPNPLSDPSEMLPTHPDKMNFHKLSVKKEEVLQIDAVVLSENTLANFWGLTRGTDALQIGEIQSTIDTKDRHQFLKLILEMARLRRHAETQKEWDTITETVRRGRAHWNFYLFKTDYVVVVVKNQSQEDVQYFVPVDEVISGAGEIDIQAAKLVISQNLALKVLDHVSDIEGFSDPDVVKQLGNMSHALQGVEHQKVDGCQADVQLGCYMTDLGYLHCMGKDMCLSDEDQCLLKVRKQIALLQIVKHYFPQISLEALEALNCKECLHVNCRDRDTLLKDLKDLNEEEDE